MNDAFFSVKEVAEIFGVNTTTVYKMAREKKIPAFKVGSQWRFSRVMINRWVNRQVMEGRSFGDEEAA